VPQFREQPGLWARVSIRRVLTWAPPMVTAAALHEVEALLAELEVLQRGKVLDLARRLRPGLTLEDVRNPHDFPELADPDWQYEDGVLAGIHAALAAVRARVREREG
jgi:hypothetical protein